LFSFENCSNLKIVQTQKIFKLENCSNSKIVQTKKLFKFENCLDFEFIQTRNCLENKKTKKIRQTSEPAEKEKLLGKTK
jgi:hypothetical protein